MMEKDSVMAAVKKVQDYYLPMLDEFDKYCRENGINYSLSGGTLLGAVRHKGFIPWDDDVDVMFDRKNYESFCKVFRTKPISGYTLVEKTWVRRLSKSDNPYLHEEKLCIDLFVFDPVPNNRFIAKLKVLLLKYLQGMMKEKPEYARFSLGNKALLLLTHLTGMCFTRTTKRNMYSRISQWGEMPSRKINIYNTWFDQIGKVSFDRAIVNDYEDIEFENHKYMVVKGYADYLTELYGNYMQLPPEKNRVPGHVIEI